MRGGSGGSSPKKRRRTPAEVEKKVERDRTLKKRKEDFKVEHLGMLLAQHERFCATRSGNERVSAGVRWGLWWYFLTGHRRGSGTWVARADLEFKDPRGEPGWGLAVWQPEVMKTQNPVHPAHPAAWTAHRPVLHEGLETGRRARGHLETGQQMGLRLARDAVRSR